jgi:hypothetical protein
MDLLLKEFILLLAFPASNIWKNHKGLEDDAAKKDHHDPEVSQNKGEGKVFEFHRLLLCKWNSMV